jgi:hypothetical protein
MLHHQEPLFIGLLSSQKKQEVCLINMQGDVNIGHLFIQKKLSVQHRKQKEEVQEKVCDI